MVAKRALRLTVGLQSPPIDANTLLRARDAGVRVWRAPNGDYQVAIRTGTGQEYAWKFTDVSHARAFLDGCLQGRQYLCREEEREVD